MSELPGIDFAEIMRQKEQIEASFHVLLFPCPFCGRPLSKEETRGFGGHLQISCACGASMGYDKGILELLAAWNRRDGKEFSLESEYAQRLVSVQSEFEAFERSAMHTLAELKKAVAVAEERAAKAEASQKERT